MQTHAVKMSPIHQKVFQEIWDLHKKWALGLLYTDIRRLETAEVFTSAIPEEYFNFAVPLVAHPSELDLSEISAALSEGGHESAVNLFEEHQQAGFIERLERDGFTLETRDAYLLFNGEAYTAPKPDHAIREITLNEFDDFRSIVAEAFESFTGNKQYGDMEEGFLEGRLRSTVSDLQLKLYLADDGGKPVAAAALFYSRNEDFGYLHDAGVRKAYRNKGYQTALIQRRVAACLDEGIERIYVSAEQGEPSFRNCIRIGFREIQTILSFVKELDKQTAIS